MTHLVKRFLYILMFPVYSVFSSNIGFTLFFRWRKQWYAYTRGNIFQVREPRLWVLEYFRHFTPPKKGIVFDVGGEFGYETKQFSKMVGPDGKVFVFECLPDHVTHLQEIAAKRPNISVVERACWNRDEQLEFYVGRTPGSNTAVPDAQGQIGQALADPSKKRIVVQAEKLDHLWQQLTGGSRVDFLKMDIEGAEYEALEGASEMLQRTSCAVIAAYHIRDGVRTAGKVSRVLRDAGFKVRIDENHHVYAVRETN